MSQQRTMCMIIGDRFADDFMHAADIFEPFKRLGVPALLEMTLDDNADLPAIIAKARETLPKKFVLSAAFFVGTSIGWVDPDIKLISDGQHFCTLEVALQTNGFNGL